MVTFRRHFLMLAAFLATLLAVLPVHAVTDDISVVGFLPPGVYSSDLDPTDFESAGILYDRVANSKVYGSVVTRTRDDLCAMFHLNLLLPTCGSPGPVTDPEKCCAAMKAFVEEGKCLCTSRVTLSGDLLPPVLKSIGEAQCPIAIPQVPDPVQLPFAILASEDCAGVEIAQGTFAANPQFLGLTPEVLAATAPEDLPTFNDLFVPPQPGPFDVSFTVVNVSRSQESSVVNEFTTRDTVQAFVVYPSNKELETIDPATGAAVVPVVADSVKPFPMMVFSAGLLVPNELFLKTMMHLASQGIVVIAPRSTHSFSELTPVNEVAAWPRDMLDSLMYLKEQTRNRKSFLYRRVNPNKAATAGHSLGGIFAIHSAFLAKERGIFVRAIVPVSPACTLFSDLCDFATDVLPKLPSKMLFISAELDLVLAPPEHQKFMQSLVKIKKLAKRKEMKGATHCLAELDPKDWVFSTDCGVGTVSPPESIRVVQELMAGFLSKTLRTEKIRGL